MGIVLSNSTFTYPNGFTANKNLSLTINEGERVAIVGQNGAGKTTAVKLMNGLNKPTDGDVLIDGESTKNRTCAQISKSVGYVFQNPDDQIFNATVRAEIEFMPRYYKMDEIEIKSRVDEAAEVTDIKKYLKQNPFDIPYPIRKFVSIAAIMVTKPKYIILDEPTAGQDNWGIATLEKLISYLEGTGVTVLTITHDMEFVQRNFTRVVAMANGNIIADGTPSDIFYDKEVLETAKIKMPQIAGIANEIFPDKRIMTIDELIENVK